MHPKVHPPEALKKGKAMTGDEMERAVDGLRKSVANLETYIEEVDRKLDGRIDEVSIQMAETSKQLRIYASTLSNFIEVVTHAFTEQDVLNRKQSKSIREIASAESRTDERLNALISVVEKHISEGGHGQAP
jgi:chromosome segregation ATPase